MCARVDECCVCLFVGRGVGLCECATMRMIVYTCMRVRVLSPVLVQISLTIDPYAAGYTRPHTGTASDILHVVSVRLSFLNVILFLSQYHEGCILFTSSSIPSMNEYVFYEEGRVMM